MTPVDVARTYLGTHDGTPFLKFLGLPKGLAWCLAFSLYCWHVAVPANKLPRVARCSLFWAKATHDTVHYRIITPSDVAWGTQLRVGDVGIFSHNPDAKTWDGHAVLVISYAGHGRVNTIEGNTSSNDKGDQRNGNTVALKTRAAGVHSFLLEGFVRPR